MSDSIESMPRVLSPSKQAFEQSTAGVTDEDNLQKPSCRNRSEREITVLLLNKWSIIESSSASDLVLC